VRLSASASFLCFALPSGLILKVRLSSRGFIAQRMLAMHTNVYVALRRRVTRLQRNRAKIRPLLSLGNAAERLAPKSSARGSGRR
jgi:hypothetical protein